MNFLYISIFSLITIVICWRCIKKKNVKQGDKDDKQEEDDRPFIVTEDGMPATLPLTYSAEVHGSVGSWFKIEHDSTEFYITSELRYYNPEMIAKCMCGGDKGELTYILTPKKRGVFFIYEIKDCRGKIESRTQHIISVR